MEKTRLGTLGSLMLLAAVVACAFTAASAQTNRRGDGEFSPAGTKWKLVEIDRKPVQGDYYLSLKQAEPLNGGSIGSLVASDWCNDYTGDYEIRDHSLHVHLGLGTLVACRVRDNKDVVPFIQTLGQTSAFKINRAILELLNQDGAVVARLAPDQD
jgi:heat shock protein HslJ